MKVNKEYYSKIVKAYEALLTKYTLEQLHDNNKIIAQDERVKDLETRIVWDYIRPACHIAYNASHYESIVAGLYQMECNDTHITTALKKACRELKII